MFIPIGDSPNFKSTPWMTYGLIAVNILVFVLLWPLQHTPADPADPAARAYMVTLAEERGVRVQEISAYDAVVFRHGFKPRFASPIDMLTAMFLHGGWMHLIGNMLFLWIYGDNVEHRLGRFGFLLAYLATGYAASMGDALLRSGSAIPSVGASGAISGVLGFYFIWFPRNRVRVWVFLFPLIMTVVELPARIVLGIYLVLDNILPALLSGGEGGVAYGAHLGGFIAAVGGGLLLDRTFLRRPEAEIRSTRPARSTSLDDRLRQFRDSVGQGELANALSALMVLPSRVWREQMAVGELLGFGRALEAEKHPRAALTVYQRMIRELADTDARAAARVGAARVLLESLAMPAEAYQHLVSALEGGPSTEVRGEAMALLDELRRRGSLPRAWNSR